MNLIRVKSIIPFLLLVVVLSTTFFTGNMMRALFFCASVLVFQPILKLFDDNALLILLYSIFYVLFAYINGALNISGVIYNLVPGVMFYIYGVWVGRCNYDKRDKLIWFYIIVIFAFASNIYLNLFMNIRSVGSIINTERVLESSNHVMIASATLIGLYVSLGLACLPIFFFDKGWKLRRIIALLIFILSLLTVIFLLNRTGLLIASIVMLVSFLYKSKGASYDIVNSLFLILIMLLVCYILFSDSWTTIMTAYADRNIDIATGGGRLNRWTEGCWYLITNPIGWSDKAKYAHNMWLDVARVSGVIPFALLAIITYRYFKVLKKYCKVSRDVFFNVACISIFTCFMCTCFVEPVVQGETMYLNLIFMSFGLLTGLYKSQFHTPNE